MTKVSAHPVHDIIGWCAWCFFLDWMHSIDLGVAAHAIGNVLFCIVYEVLKKKTRSAACQEIAGFLMEQTSNCEHGSQLSALDLKNFVTDVKAPHQHYPELQKMKAAEVRALVPAVTLLADVYALDSDHWSHMKKMMQSLNAMYQVIYQAGMFLTPLQFKLLDKSSTRFLLEYSHLSKEAARNGQLRFSVTPKFHYMCHIIQQSEFLNPRFTWCYGGEDLVGAASALAHSCTDGTSGWHVQAKTLEKYRVAKHMEWTLQ